MSITVLHQLLKLETMTTSIKDSFPGTIRGCREGCTLLLMDPLGAVCVKVV